MQGKKRRVDEDYEEEERTFCRETDSREGRGSKGEKRMKKFTEKIHKIHSIIHRVDDYLHLSRREE